MKPYLFTIVSSLLILLSPIASGQTFYAGPMGGKDIVVTKGPKVQKDNIRLRYYAGDEYNPELYYIHTETSNDFDGYFRFFLGYDKYDAARTIEKLEQTLSMPVGTDASFTFENEKECHIWVKDSKKSGKILVFKNMEDGGVVFIDSPTLSVLKEALKSKKGK